MAFAGVPHLFKFSILKIIEINVHECGSSAIERYFKMDLLLQPGLMVFQEVNFN